MDIGMIEGRKEEEQRGVAGGWITGNGRGISERARGKARGARRGCSFPRKTDLLERFKTKSMFICFRGSLAYPSVKWISPSSLASAYFHTLSFSSFYWLEKHTDPRLVHLSEEVIPTPQNPTRGEGVEILPSSFVPKEKTNL